MLYVLTENRFEIGTYILEGLNGVSKMQTARFEKNGMPWHAYSMETRLTRTNRANRNVLHVHVLSLKRWGPSPEQASTSTLSSNRRGSRTLHRWQRLSYRATTAATKAASSPTPISATKMKTTTKRATAVSTVSAEVQRVAPRVLLTHPFLVTLPPPPPKWCRTPIDLS